MMGLPVRKERWFPRLATNKDMGRESNKKELDLLDAVEAALDEFHSRDCCCDGASDGKYACYFHRIEDDLRRALDKARKDR